MNNPAMRNGFGGFNFAGMAAEHARYARMGIAVGPGDIRPKSPVNPHEARQSRVIMQAMTSQASAMYQPQQMNSLAGLMQGLQQLYTAFSAFAGGPSLASHQGGWH